MSAARERIAKFCAVWEKIYHRQPLVYIIPGLQPGEPNEAELTLSDLKALLAERPPAAWGTNLKEGDSVRVIDPPNFYMQRGWIDKPPAGPPDIPGKLKVVFETGGHAFFLPIHLEKVED
jgi:hypothetical protein